MKPSPVAVWAVLGIALVVISFASIWIRWAEAPAISIAVYRVGLAALILTPIVLSTRRPQLRKLTPNDLGYALLGGICLALHFIFWISSLEFTSVASSVVLVTTNPIFVALGSHFILKESVTLGLVLGIGVSLLGGVLIGYGDFLAGSNMLLGDGLALLGAIMASAYFLVGRRLRAYTDLLTYVSLVYGAGALVLVAMALFLQQPLLGFRSEAYLWMVLLALGPQLVGHTSFNWALKHLSAGTVAVIILGEPVGSTVLAYFFLHEPITLVKALGGVLILVGIYLSSRR